MGIGSGIGYGCLPRICGSPVAPFWGGLVGFQVGFPFQKPQDGKRMKTDHLHFRKTRSEDETSFALQAAYLQRILRGGCEQPHFWRSQFV